MDDAWNEKKMERGKEEAMDEVDLETDRDGERGDKEEWKIACGSKRGEGCRKTGKLIVEYTDRQKVRQTGIR